METAALIVWVVALAGVAFAIWFQWGMYKASTAQLGSAQQVLSKLEGVSLQLRETQQQQFRDVLRALIEERRQAASDAGDQARLAETRLADLERRLEKEPELAEEMHELRQALDGLRAKIHQLEEPGFDLLGELGEAGADKLGFLGPPVGRWWPRTHDDSGREVAVGALANAQSMPDEPQPSRE